MAVAGAVLRSAYGGLERLCKLLTDVCRVVGHVRVGVHTEGLFAGHLVELVKSQGFRMARFFRGLLDGFVLFGDQSINGKGDPLSHQLVYIIIEKK